MSYEWYEPLAKALAKDGMSRADISSVLRINPKQTASALAKPDLAKPLWQDIYLAEWESGMTGMEIAERHGVHYGTVYKALNRLRMRGEAVSPRRTGRRRRI